VKYAIVISCCKEDAGFIATVPEFPGCSAFGEAEEGAIREANIAVSLWIEAAKKEVRRIPPPISEKEFKRRFPLRIPEDVRRRLELEAKRKGISLNRLILQKIA
jgi:predicted RNase H-like HicB family nuclease